MLSFVKKISLIIIFLFTIGCTSTVLKSSAFKTYSVGETVNANIGSPFLVAQTGTVQTVRRWVGVLNSPDGWGTTDFYSPDYIKKELVYSGKSGDTIDISYREYRGDLAAQAFYQSLSYDLSESTEVSFQNFRFRINSATNSAISVTILSD